MERFPIERELDIMLPETNEDNINNFRMLLPHFYLDSDSNKRILASLEEHTRDYKLHFLDKFLDLNEQRRAWFEIDTDAQNDGAYQIQTLLFPAPF